MMFVIQNLDSSVPSEQFAQQLEAQMAPRNIRINQIIPLETLENQKNDDKYCGGLLNRNDPFCIKALKLIFAVPLIPILLVFMILQWICQRIISFCSNQVYRCLVYCYGKFCECMTWLWNRIVDLCTAIWNGLYCCISYVCTAIWNVIKCLGRCSKHLLDMYAVFAVSMIMKCAHLRSLIQEISSFITIPISLKVLVPIYFCFYNYCYTPITDCLVWSAVKLYECIVYTIKKAASLLYTYLIKPFYTYILVSIYRIFKFLIVNVFYNGILVNLCRGLRWILVNFYQYILCKFLYEIILVNICLTIRWILVNFYKYIIYNFYEYVLRRFLYELIIVNICRALRWILINFYEYILVRFFYNIILVNFWKLFKLIFYNFFYKIIVVSIYRCVKWILIEILYRKIILNIYRAIKWFLQEVFYNLFLVNLFRYIIHPVYRGLVATVKFIMTNINRFIIQPLWIATKFIVNGILTIISGVSRFLYNQILTPIGRLVKRIIISTANLIKLMANFIGQLSVDIWRAIKNLAQRFRR